jgi:hypothetical protein
MSMDLHNFRKMIHYNGKGEVIPLLKHDTITTGDNLTEVQLVTIP